MPEHFSTDDSIPLNSLSSRREYRRLSSEDQLNSYGGAGDGDIGIRPSSYTASRSHGITTTMSRIPLQSMMRQRVGASGKAGGMAVISSYVFDWIVVLVVLGIAGYMNNHEPNRRPFSLEDPTIS